jgi:hypothetical protein
MSFTDAVIAAALSLPAPTYRDTPPETPEQYRARVSLIGEVVADETTSLKTDRYAVAAAVLVTFRFESAFRLEVHSGAIRGDHGKAICLSQQWQNSLSRADWEALAGISPEATRRCVRMTIETLLRAHRHCARDVTAGLTETAVARAFRLLGTGRTCEPGRGALRRAAEWRRVLASLRAHRASQSEIRIAGNAGGLPDKVSE